MAARILAITEAPGLRGGGLTLHAQTCSCHPKYLEIKISRSKCPLSCSRTSPQTLISSRPVDAQGYMENPRI